MVMKESTNQIKKHSRKYHQQIRPAEKQISEMVDKVKTQRHIKRKKQNKQDQSFQEIYIFRRLNLRIHGLEGVGHIVYPI